MFTCIGADGGPNCSMSMEEEKEEINVTTIFTLRETNLESRLGRRLTGNDAFGDVRIAPTHFSRDNKPWKSADKRHEFLSSPG